MTDLPTRLRVKADSHDHLTAALMRAAADEIERLTREHAEFAELVSEYAQAERPEAMEILAADRDKWWKTAEKAEAEVSRFKAERLLTDRRIRAQRAELRKNWGIVEQRVGLTTTLRMFRMLQGRGKELRAAEAEAARLRETLTYIRDWPTVHDNGKPFNRDELVLLLAQMSLEAARSLKAAPASSPIVRTGE